MRGSRLGLAGTALISLLLVLASCSLARPATLDKDEIPFAVSAKQISESSLNFEEYFRPNCNAAARFAKDLLENAEFIEGIEYTDDRALGWGFTQIILRADSSNNAERLALAFSGLLNCVGVPVVDVRYLSLKEDLGISGTGTAIGQDVDLGSLGQITGIKAMVSKGRYLVYIDTYGSSFSGWDSQSLLLLAAKALK